MRFLPPEWLDEVTSTNSVLRARVDSPAAPPDGYVVAARDQTAGRGRFERCWESGRGRDLTFSFVLHPGAEAADLSTLAMAVALGVADFLSSRGMAARTKWPNDVLVSDRKICGILAELCSRSDGGRVMVVGVGLNVNMAAPQLAGIDRPATSMAVETGVAHDVEALLPPLLDCLETRIQTWCGGGFAAIREDWQELCLYVGQQVLIEDGQNMWQGKMVGFGNEGELILKLPNGESMSMWSGDVVRARPA